MLSRCDETAIMMFSSKTCGVCSGDPDASNDDNQQMAILPTEELDLMENDNAASTRSRETSVDIVTIGICIAVAVMVVGVCVASVAFYKNAGKNPGSEKKPIYGFRENYRENPILELGPRGNQSDLDDLAWEVEDTSSVATSHHNRPHEKASYPRYSNQFENLCQNLQSLDSSNSESSGDGGTRAARHKKLERQKQDRAAAAAFEQNATLRDAFVTFMHKLNMEMPSATNSDADTLNSRDDIASESSSHTAIKSATSATSYNSQQQAQIAQMVASGMSGGMTQQQFEAMATTAGKFAQQQQQHQGPSSFSPSTGSYVEIVPGSGSPAPPRSILRNSPQSSKFDRPHSEILSNTGHMPGETATLQSRNQSKVEWNLPYDSPLAPPKGWQQEGLRQHRNSTAAAMSAVSPDTSYLVPSRSEGQPEYEEPHPGTRDRDSPDDFSDRVYDNFSIVMPNHGGREDRTNPGAAGYHEVGGTI
jgi:hypothetical protein